MKLSNSVLKKISELSEEMGAVIEKDKLAGALLDMYIEQRIKDFAEWMFTTVTVKPLHPIEKLLKGKSSNKNSN